MQGCSRRATPTSSTRGFDRRERRRVVGLVWSFRVQPKSLSRDMRRRALCNTSPARKGTTLHKAIKRLDQRAATGQATVPREQLVWRSLAKSYMGPCSGISYTGHDSERAGTWISVAGSGTHSRAPSVSIRGPVPVNVAGTLAIVACVRDPRTGTHVAFRE